MLTRKRREFFRTIHSSLPFDTHGVGMLIRWGIERGARRSQNSRSAYAESMAAMPGERQVLPPGGDGLRERLALPGTRGTGLAAAQAVIEESAAKKNKKNKK